MNKFKHYFLSLFLCVSLLIGFSTIANAEEVEVKPYNVIQQNEFNSTVVDFVFGIKIFSPSDGTVTKSSETVRNNSVTSYVLQTPSRNAKYVSRMSFQAKDLTPLLEADTNYTISIKNIYYSMLVTFPINGKVRYTRNPDNIYVLVCYDENNYEEIHDIEITYVNNSPLLDIKFDVKTTDQVQNIAVIMKNNIPNILSELNVTDEVCELTSYFGEYDNVGIGGDNGHKLVLTVESEESSLLKSVIDWLKGIKGKIDDTFSSVTNGFSNITSWLSNVVNNIIELPSKIWTFISDGLKELFVPDENQLKDIKDDWDMLLSQRFGALYESIEVFDMIINDTILNQSAAISDSGKIAIPQVSLESYGIPFKFGGYIVDIEPEGFEFLITIVKRVISISCALMFINAMRKRYEEIFR